ncbi:LAQU0S06e04434g1_1 [Lachancea quebecensis]|uniref:LAQU0S06e04434g1_1 n=1 Tax=Lachancea quebecensis TaxID=1654605 RepID=A0A0P1KS95_9SACH|nr:LAQU0S06e04434g1_1 [Lachancea quebecensis]
MAKRIADAQITRESLATDADDQEVDVEPSNGFKKASNDVMRTRRIAQPRKKRQLGAGAGAGAGAESSMANAFSLSGGLGSAAGASAGAGAGRATSDAVLGARRKALNLQFQAKIAQVIAADPAADLSSVFTQYQDYLCDMQSGEKPAAQPAAQPATKPATKPAEKPAAPEARSDSESDSDDGDVKVQGPSFTLTQKPTTSSPVFSFGPKKPAKRDPSDSESEVEIKGPQFTFQNKEASKPSNSVFKLKTEPAKSDPEPSAAPDKTQDQAQPQQPKFSFGSEKAVKPAFTFGKPAAVDDKPAQEKPAQNKPAFSFSFGANKTDNENSKTVSAFGSSSESSKPDAEQKPTPFSFPKSNPAPAQEASPKPFSFGQSTPAVNKQDGSEQKPSFSFGQPAADKPKPSFTFGAPGNASANSEDAQEKKSDEKPKPFTFGASSSPAAPSFSFGKPAAPKEPPSGGFKFSLPFSSNTSAPAAGQNASQSTDAKGSDSAAVEKPEAASEAKTEAASEPKADSEQGQAMVMSNGEEGENLLFSKRAKLMVINPETKAYESRGVGELKLLQSKDDKAKVRILCRSDGMGHILLNTKVVKSFQYNPADADKENFVKCPVVNADGKLENYIIRVKQKADGRQLCKSISDAQESM